MSLCLEQPSVYSRRFGRPCFESCFDYSLFYSWNLSDAKSLGFHSCHVGTFHIIIHHYTSLYCTLSSDFQGCSRLGPKQHWIADAIIAFFWTHNVQTVHGENTWLCCRNQKLWWWWLASVVTGTAVGARLGGFPRQPVANRQALKCLPSIYTSLGLKLFPSPVSEQSNVYLFADQHFESEGHFAWSAWWIEFTSRFKLTFKILRRNFFGRSLWGKGVEKPKRKNLCPAGVCNS